MPKREKSYRSTGCKIYRQSDYKYKYPLYLPPIIATRGLPGSHADQPCKSSNRWSPLPLLLQPTKRRRRYGEGSLRTFSFSRPLPVTYTNRLDIFTQRNLAISGDFYGPQYPWQRSSNENTNNLLH
jgi:hypothetical protein